MALNIILVEQFINSHDKAPKELILDVDASDVPLHGEQELRAFHGYYDSYCFLPLKVIDCDIDKFSLRYLIFSICNQ